MLAESACLFCNNSRNSPSISASQVFVNWWGGCHWLHKPVGFHSTLCFSLLILGIDIKKYKQVSLECFYQKSSCDWIYSPSSQFLLHTGTKQDIFMRSRKPDTVNSQLVNTPKKSTLSSRQKCVFTDFHTLLVFVITKPRQALVLPFWGNICWYDYVGPC